MTDNEKRAHDLAIAYIPILMKTEMRDIACKASKENAEISVSFYDLYLEVYERFLENLQGDFPDTP